jgi:hypothetical protein
MAKSDLELFFQKGERISRRNLRETGSNKEKDSCLKEEELFCSTWRERARG